MFQIAQRLKIIRRLAAVEVHRHRLVLDIDLLQKSDVSVEHAEPAAPVRAFPEHVIVVAVLDQAVSFPENHIPDRTLLFLRRGRIQGRLQEPVQGRRATVPFSGGGQDLNLLRRNPHLLREAGTAQFHHRLRNRAGLHALQPEEIARVLREIRVLTAVDQVCVAYDAAALPLAEDLRQHHRRHRLAAQDGREHIARAYRGQLRRVSHQHQAGRGR